MRNRILSFVLEIEKEAPDAGESKPSEEPIAQEKVNHVFNTTIYGNVGNIAEGNRDVIQTANLNIMQNDLESLKKFLTSINMPKVEIAELEKSINDDSSEKVIETKSFGVKVLSWLGQITTKIAMGTLSLANKVGAEIVRSHFSVLWDKLILANRSSRYSTT